ncbi:hypothetical protein [Polaromonas sp.]|uniref:hypothetical protein n=1 Tax=Polaromonas sp. TaxID=1869339 RepID=UPI00286A66DF|nr:hypothetical protein [Polaromonas sp.]
MSDAATSATTQRELRKQVLLMRAAMERAEMVGAIDAARQRVIFFKNGVPSLALAKGLPLALALLRRAPLLSSLLSLALSGARRLPLLRYGLLGAGAALLVWKGYQWLAGRAGQSAEPSPDQPIGADAPPM